MNASIIYDLDWKSVPMGAIKDYENWYDSYLGCGVYMLVVATTDNRYVGFYVGKSDDLGRRWREHVHQWFVAPHEGYWIPANSDVFLEDPVAVINEGAFCQGLPNRAVIQGRILDQTWFTFAEIHSLQSDHRLDDLEYVLQEALKRHADIVRHGYIGDAANRQCPTTELTIRNHFGRCFLRPTLPDKICFKPDR